MSRVRSLSFIVSLAFLLLGGTAFAEQYGRPSALTLVHALELVKRSSLVLSAARHRIDEARGDLTGASVLLVNNPTLAVSAGPRFYGASEQDPTLDVEVGVQQTFELGGQRSDRVARARAEVAAAQASAEDVRRVVELAVAVAFYEALANKQELDLLLRHSQLAGDLHNAARRRLDAGESTPLELNTARIRLAEAQRRVISARTALRVSSVRLAQLLGMTTGTALDVAGDLPTQRAVPTVQVLLDRARRARPDLIAVQRRVAASRADLALANAEAWPDIKVGAFYGQEEGNQIVGASLQLPIPLFNRNQGERQRARASLERSLAERDAQSLTVTSEVQQAFLLYEQARQTLDLYDAEVLQAQQDSLVLLRGAFEAGEVGIPDVIIVQRELLTGQEGFLEARLELARALATALASANLPQTSAAQGATP